MPSGLLDTDVDPYSFNIYVTPYSWKLTVKMVKMRSSLEKSEMTQQ